MMQTITFYAYKGGTGRTLALTKAAGFLADEGKRVFILDLDLEAPGLHFKLLDNIQREALCPGFVELAHQYVDDGYWASIDGHYVRVNRASEKGGEVLLMPAGRAFSADYWQKLTKLNWQELFGSERGTGVPLFLELRDKIRESCDPEFLLIDARTGITEVGGAALTLLPDAVVCLLSNNPESKWGTREAIRTIARTPRLRSQEPVRVVPVLARFPYGEDSESDRIKELLSYLNEPAQQDGASPGFERIFVLHSYRKLEVDEQSELDHGEEKGGPLKADYHMLFTEGLGVTMDELAVGRSVEQAERAAGTEEAFARWLEALDGLLEDPERAPADIQEALNGLEAAYSAQSKYDEALPRLQRLMDRQGPPRIRTTAAQLFALALARIGRFQEISADILSIALEPSNDDEDTLQRASRLKEAYDAAALAGRYRSYEIMVIDLGRRWEAAGAPARAEEVLRSGLRYFADWGDEGMMSDLPIRHRLANLLYEMERFEEAEAELRETEVGYRRLGGSQSVPMQLQEDLARVLEAQNLPDAAEVVRKRLARRSSPRPPVVRPLPGKRPRASRASPDIVSFDLPLQLVTPLFGGAAEARKIDDIDVVRAPSVRGHLRFWWRALHGGRLAGEELYMRERRLWGGVGDNTGVRSTVEIRVDVKARGKINTSDVMPYGKNQTPGAYALWPARASQGTRAQPAAQRREPGTRFSLHVTCHAGDEPEVRAAVRAWVLFGGYGGRTRRGAGGLSIDGGADDRRSWVPADRTREAIREVFQQDVLAPIAARPRDDVPLLAGAGLRLGRPTVDAMAAWTTALHWLRDFRQMQPDSRSLGAHDSNFARDRGDTRPGRSNWPEADKIRQLQSAGSNTRWAHEPRHNANPVWPRAGFGLPIVGQFQRTDRRTRTHYPPPGEPRDFELRWRGPKGHDGRQEVHDRLASPLIVKSLALSDGQFVPCALWLYRAYPAGGEVILAPNDSRSAGSAAAFDALVAEGDTPRYAPLARPPTEHPGERLRNAFFDWLAKDSSVRTVAP